MLIPSVPKISVIIPVYNVANYLPRCLNSVINQTFSDLEIIVVNDGSTDDSLSVIQEFMAQDNRIRLIDKKNQGVVIARRVGLEAATADYIHYLDGDDYLEPDAYELLYQKAVETNADMVLFDFWFENEETGEKKASKSYEEPSYPYMDYLRHIMQWGGYFAVWGYLHKRALYNNKIDFYSALTVGEDAYLTCQLGYYSNNIIPFTEKPLLHYMERPESVSTAAFSRRKIESTLLFPDLIQQFLKQTPEYDLIDRELASLKIQSFNNVISAGYLQEVVWMSQQAMKYYKRFPELKGWRTNKSFYKLYRAYTLHPKLGELYCRYYKMKKKIKPMLA